MDFEEWQAAFAARYENDDIPWDDELPPPEVIEMAEKLAPGRVLDIGCGYGRTCTYLAQHGWQADGVDFVEKAIAEAEIRAKAIGVADAVHYFQGSVTAMSFLTASYDLAVDVGCLHSMPQSELIGYRNELKRLLREGAIYLLYARILQDGAESEADPRGVLETAVRALFADGFVLERFEPGVTEMDDAQQWQSAWFWYKRAI
ncbi:MAG: class I SAM-dependent methyltransferase [Chloroflexi bacterium]|nr:class I SAM-dependent methyltransferase [Chloroflexota bacterium]